MFFGRHTIVRLQVRHSGFWLLISENCFYLGKFDMNIIEIAPKLSLIPLDQDIPGFGSFIGSWLYKGEKTFLVDVGPAATVPLLINALDSLGVKSLDAILLTHIHIDHAGGIGDLASRFPDTPVVCHGSGIPHLRDPSRLWQGSVKTLGDVATGYWTHPTCPRGVAS